MRYKRFDIIVTAFPYLEKEQKKVRPGIVISSQTYNEETGFLVVAMITSAKHSKLWNDVKVVDFEKIGLSHPSLIRMKFANILHDEVIDKIGSLGKEDQKSLEENLKQVFR